MDAEAARRKSWNFRGLRFPTKGEVGTTKHCGMSYLSACTLQSTRTA